MPRSLPWLNGEINKTSKPSLTRPAKRQKTVVDQNLDDDDAPPPPTKPKPNFGAVSGAARSPSTSPPPEPPTEEFMLGGLDQDDIYIMVEDEFHAVARTFTQHLHHAEYVRLKNLARSRNASAASKISRPVDSITMMRAEAKKKKEAELREAKNKTALEQLKSTDRARILSSGDSDLSEPEDKDEGHWKGTALQGLMTISPHKNHFSLTGLQGIKSTTRAAAGFSKPEAKFSSRPSAKPYDLAPKPPPQRKPRPPTPFPSPSTSSSDDDLDAPIPKRPPAIPTPPLAKPPMRKTVSTPAPDKIPFSIAQESPPRPSLIETATARRRAKARMSREEMEKGKDAKVEIDEIPVFLY